MNIDNKKIRAKTPEVTVELIKYLKEVYPYPQLSRSTRIEDVHHFSGVLSVIGHLEALLNLQSK
jgi:hypothetical protein